MVLLPFKVVPVIARQTRLSQSGRGEGKDPSRMYLLAGHIGFRISYYVGGEVRSRQDAFVSPLGLMTSFLIDKT